MAVLPVLDDTWRARLDALAAEEGWPGSSNPTALADGVAALSTLYNLLHRGPVLDADAVWPARLGFFFPRDVPKGAAVVRELIEHHGDLDERKGPLRILDLGSGLGATYVGAALAARRAGFDGPIEVLAVDRDPKALSLGAKLARPIRRLSVRTKTAEVGDPLPDESFDWILLGQVLCELDEQAPEDERVEQHAAWIADLLVRHATEGGSVGVVEPALREPTRHLHRVRDRLVTAGATVFAPCLHDDGCPMLAKESDWCHERHAISLPEWLVPVARSAGLRYEGLTYSYLVICRDGSKRPGTLRAVSERLVSKGRSDVWVCGELPEGADRRKIGRLDRHRSDANGEWDQIERGDVLEIDPFAVKVTAETQVRRA